VTEPAEHDIPRRSQELKLLHLGLMMAIPSLFDPSLPVLRTVLGQVQEPTDDMPLYVGGREGEESIRFSIQEI
jgi:hypothetical protein